MHSLPEGHNNNNNIVIVFNYYKDMRILLSTKEKAEYLKNKKLKINVTWLA